ncbi:SOUL family heme-binding protein [Flavobacterium sp.]|uniref:SOUL family heme-binding protein n=1 Tax=Flavobacterium sp. TaxID=239 RepID=UPI003BECB4ED
MKAVIIIIISILVLLTIAQIYLSRSTQQTEQHSYKVIKKLCKFEIRKYDAALFSSVKLNKKGYKESSSEGFGILAGYIFGDNEANEKIAMTSPVVMELGDTSKMMFMVPKNYNLKNLPNPKNSKIVFEKKEEKIIAAIRFDGWADDEKIEKYKTILMNELVNEKLNFINKFSFLGYNPPFEVINRRNEVVVELINYK